MDYSNVSNDLDNPGGSPWATTSPRSDRSMFAHVTGDSESPPSPVPGEQDQSGDVSPTAGRQPSVSTNVTPSTGPISADDEVGSPDLSERLQSAQLGDEDYPVEHERSPYHQHLQAQQYSPESHRPAAARYQQGPKPQRPVPVYKLQAKITALERSGRKDPVLRFDVHTNLPKFRTTQFRDVRRTHAEFVKLAHHLISSNPEAIVPAVPSAVTSAGAGTDEDENKVKSSLQRWLNYVCSNDVLMRDDEMVFFVESDFGYSPVVNMKQPATGVRRRVLKQFAPPPDNTPELHEARPVVKMFYLATLDAHQKMEKMLKARRGLGSAESSLGEKLTQMHVQETHPGLSTAYRKLGRVIQTCGDLHLAQGTAEATTLGDPLNYHSQDAFIVKETLTNRHILLRELLQAEATRKSKESSVTRMKSSTSVRRDKVDEAINSLEEAASQETYLRQKTQRVTSNLLFEKRRWFARTAADLNRAIREHALREIEVERRMLSTLESVRPDIRAIDASGGLSRLGREHNLAARRASLASSQGVKGDAWSGVPRTRDSLTRSINAAGAPPIAEEDEEEDGEGVNGAAAAGKGRTRSNTASGLAKDEDEDRVDARNAASRLAQSTF